MRFTSYTRFLHYVTTSVNVHGDYAAYGEETASSVAITYGHSKDKRPDNLEDLKEQLFITRLPANYKAEQAAIAAAADPHGRWCESWGT